MKRFKHILLVLALLGVAWAAPGCGSSLSGGGDEDGLGGEVEAATEAEAGMEVEPEKTPESAEPLEEASEPQPEEGADAEVLAEEVAADLPPEQDEATPEEELPPKVCPVDGVPCDDGDPCTYHDQCKAGACQGDGYACDDDRPCTDDECDGEGNCLFTRRDGWCLINGQCVEDGKGLPGNWCTKCKEATNPWAWTLDAFGDCVDDDPCTVNEHCVDGRCEYDGLLCDDGNPCTTDWCQAGAGCQATPNFLACDNLDLCDQGDICVDGECRGGDQKLDCDDDNDCTLDSCDPALGCQHAAGGGGCTDGDVCTSGDHCEGEVCVPGEQPLNCNDGNLCTADTCHPIVGCLHKMLENNICCQGGKSPCDDGNYCTTDNCDPETGDCSWVINDLPCDDGDACTAGDHCVDQGGQGTCVPTGPTDCDDGTECTLDTCDPYGGCFHAPLAGTCDDHDVCTAGDSCINGKCVGDMKICNDGNLCTEDKCNPVTGECYGVPNTVPCDDKNICTVSDHCAGGACTGSSLPCEDGNLCTTDSCDPAAGCRHTPYYGACNDGLDCTTGDNCSTGVCLGNDALCTNCPPTFSDTVSKFTLLAIGSKGIPGEGIDVDNNPATCSPTPGCSGGIDNSMSKFAGIANPEIEKAMQKGEIALLFEHVAGNFNGVPYTVNMFAAKPANDTCDIMFDVCDYLVDPNSMDAKCNPVVFYDNFTAQNGSFHAGGPTAVFPFDLNLGAISITATLYYAQMMGTYTTEAGKLKEIDGVLGGAVSKPAIIEIINTLPPETWESSPLTKDQILNLINILLVPDMDINGDGTKEGASLGLKFHGIPGHIVGLKPD
jgi:hypothetical protein